MSGFGQQKAVNSGWLAVIIRRNYQGFAYLSLIILNSATKAGIHGIRGPPDIIVIAMKKVGPTFSLKGRWHLSLYAVTIKKIALLSQSGELWLGSDKDTISGRSAVAQQAIRVPASSSSPVRKKQRTIISEITSHSLLKGKKLAWSQDHDPLLIEWSRFHGFPEGQAEIFIPPSGKNND